jgi:sec-independent protein translocase protein TatB
MFDFAWSELALIGVVALVAIGPKDMPVAIKSIAKLVKKARRMAGEFQTHVDDLLKEADLSEMQGHLSGLRSRARAPPPPTGRCVATWPASR